MAFTNKNIFYTLLLTLLFFSKQIIANIDLKFQHVTLKNGLSSNQYNGYIFEDSRGFVWISSTDGLNRFDGLEVKNYRFESGLKDTNIQSTFFEDKEKNIWFASHRAINCYFPSLDSIKTYQVKDSTGNIIESGYRALHLDTVENNLWIKAASNIFKLNIDSTNKYTQLSIATNAFIFKLGIGLDSKPESLALIDRTDKLQIINFTNESSKTYQVPYHNNAIHLKENKWLLLKADKWFIFDEKEPNQVVYLKNKEKLKFFDAVKLNKDTLMVATQNDGLWLYNWQKEKFLKNWKNENDQNFTLQSNEPRELYLSKSGYLFTSHRNKGVDFAYINESQFYNPIIQHSNKKVEVTSIFESIDRNIWVSTKRNGVYVFNLSGDLLHYYNYPFDGITSTELYQVTQNKNGEIFGITAQAIYKFDIKDKSVKNIIPKTKGLWFWYMNSVFKNRDFISSSDGILQLVQDDNENYLLQVCPELAQYKGANFMQMFATSKNRLLIPYAGRELLTFDVKRDSLKLIKKDTSSAEFFGFFEDEVQTDKVWAGTASGLKLIGLDNIEAVFETNTELGIENIFGVVQDKKNRLWLSTNKGIWSYDLNHPDQEPIQYQELDGLSGNLFSRYYSSILAANGEIWMGYNNGLVKFDPKEIVATNNVPKIHIEELLINDAKSIKGISNQDTLLLKYGDNTLTFDINAVNLYKAEANKIYYQLEGLTDDWLQINNGEKIRFIEIEPGQYNLKVQATDSKGNRSAEKDLLILKIKPPFWKTWWFYALCTLLNILILYMLYAYRVKQIEQRESLNPTWLFLKLAFHFSPILI